MRSALRLLIVLAISGTVRAQDLAPRAYVITPVGSNAVTFSYSYNSGAVFVDPTIPVENAGSHFQTNILSYYYSFGLLGRSANVVVFLPYATGTFEGDIAGTHQETYRSGLADGRVRFAVNLRGARAMSVKEYVAWHEKTTIGASLTVSVPTGQYDPARLINSGANRWAFRPELGLTRRWGKWMLDGYGGAWFFTANHRFYPGANVRTQALVPSGEAHFGYYVKPRLWVSFDANFWAGGRSAINGVKRQDHQRNSRVGATISIPAGRHQSFKLSYTVGAYVTIGGDYKTVSAAWQYSWLSKRE
jgi:hypothetical protein